MSTTFDRARRAATVALAFVCCGAMPSVASVPDSWMPFSNKRVVAPSGKRYVVVRKKGRGITFELCERRAGVAPIEPATASSMNLRGRPQPDISRDPKDRLVANGSYKQMPMQVLLADGLDGFLLFDKYANVGYGEVITWIDGNGKAVVEHSLQDLFGGRPKGTTASVSSLWWSRSVWLDARKRSAIVLTSAGELREVALADGEVSVPKRSRLLDWAMHGSPDGRATALELIAEGDVDGCRKAMPLVSGTFLDRSQPRALRLRAGWILQRAGAAEGVKELYLESVRGGEGIADEDMRFAVRHLGQVLGDDALAVLRDLMRGKAGAVWGEAYQAFAAMGEPAVPTLLEMLAEAEESADYRGGAAHALAEIGSLAAVPALREALSSGSDYVAGAARGALGRTFWKVVDRAWAKVPATVARDAIDASTVAPLVEQLRAFDEEWVIEKLDGRIGKSDLRFSRYLERTRGGL